MSETHLAIRLNKMNIVTGRFISTDTQKLQMAMEIDTLVKKAQKHEFIWI